MDYANPVSLILQGSTALRREYDKMPKLHAVALCEKRCRAKPQRPGQCTTSVRAISYQYTLVIVTEKNSGKRELFHPLPYRALGAGSALSRLQHAPPSGSALRLGKPLVLIGAYLLSPDNTYTAMLITKGHLHVSLEPIGDSY
jgi:hypothetical protein